MTMTPRDQQISTQMHAWIERFVIDLNLCPFARRPVETGKLRLVVTDATETEALLMALHEELLRLHQTPASELETTLLVVPDMLQEFLDYNDFLDLAEALISDADWHDDYQIASFHPHYRFANSAVSDAANFSNRSPWPALHLLRQRSVTAALEYVEDPEQIPLRNIRTLRAIGSQSLEQRLADLPTSVDSLKTAPPPQQD